MSWTRLDDLWCERQELAGLDFADRWHYLCLVQFLSRSDRRDGWIRAVDARRVSDHPDPAQALANIEKTGLLVLEKGGYRVVDVDDHLPSEASRKRTQKNREYKQRQRRHQAGDHSTCLPKNCPLAPSVSADGQGNVSADVGTGRDGTGLASYGNTSQKVNESTGEVVDWPAAIPGEPEKWTSPDAPGSVLRKRGAA